ncbi:pyruvate kinase, partial [bacterium]|nr:pyruvate kinase [candidate division CSSED10-310 bacterium]
MIRKTKIVCTIGPATASLDALRELAEAGMDVARLNFSHGTHAWHGEVIDRIKRLREDTGRNIGLLQDLSGPKIRLGDLPETGVELKTGGYVRLTAGGVFQEDPGLSLPVMYEQLLEDLPAGAIILLDDGLVRLRVENRQADALVCSILHGGKMSSRKGVNFPGAMLSCRAPTEKDMEDLAFGIRQGVDFVALSFVQTPDDVRRLRSAINDLDGRVAVIAKVEKENALRNLDAILEACDGVMVARGDLGIE